MVNYMLFLCDILFIEYMLIDLLDFVLLVVGLGLKIGLDVIVKWFVELVVFNFDQSDKIMEFLLEVLKVCLSDEVDVLDVVLLEVVNDKLVFLFINKQEVGQVQ